MDKAHNLTDKILKQTNKKNKQQYQEAYKNIREKILEYYLKFNLTNDMTTQQKIDEINKYNRYNNIVDLIVEDIVVQNKNAIKNINAVNTEIYQANYNIIANENISKAESNKDIKENPNPYNEVAIDTLKDKTDIKKKVSNTLLNSLLGGVSFSQLLGGIVGVYENNLESSIRIATTQATRLENLARTTAMNELEKEYNKKGQSVVKVWKTMLDDRVRDAHARAEGQEAELNRPFYVGGERLMYPCDISGSPANIINCRCSVWYKIVDIGK